MKRLALTLLVLFACAVWVTAQEHGQPARTAAEPSTQTGAEHGSEQHGDSDALTLWKWANFAILAGVLGWMVSKVAPQFFRSRTQEIQRGIADATRMKQDAEARAAKVEMRMASLQNEIEHIRAEARAEMGKEVDRIRRDSEQQIARILAHGQQEITAMAKHAEQHLHAYSAELALRLAEERLRARMDGQSQEVLFDGFVRHLNENTAGTEVRQ